MRMMYSTINTHRQTNPTLISYMQRYQVYVAYNDQQDIVWVEEQQKGSMNLKKESANSIYEPMKTAVHSRKVQFNLNR